MSSEELEEELNRQLDDIDVSDIDLTMDVANDDWYAELRRNRANLWNSLEIDCKDDNEQRAALWEQFHKSHQSKQAELDDFQTDIAEVIEWSTLAVPDGTVDERVEEVAAIDTAAAVSEIVSYCEEHCLPSCKTPCAGHCPESCEVYKIAFERHCAIEAMELYERQNALREIRKQVAHKEETPKIESVANLDELNSFVASVDDTSIKARQQEQEYAIEMERQAELLLENRKALEAQVEKRRLEAEERAKRRHAKFLEITSQIALEAEKEEEYKQQQRALAVEHERSVHEMIRMIDEDEQSRCYRAEQERLLEEAAQAKIKKDLAEKQRQMEELRGMCKEEKFERDRLAAIVYEAKVAALVLARIQEEERKEQEREARELMIRMEGERARNVRLMEEEEAYERTRMAQELELRQQQIEIEKMTMLDVEGSFIRKQYNDEVEHQKMEKRKLLAIAKLRIEREAVERKSMYNEELKQRAIAQAIQEKMQAVQQSRQIIALRQLFKKIISLKVYRASYNRWAFQTRQLRDAEQKLIPIQRIWRRHVKSKKFRAICLVQSVFRGHYVRKRISAALQLSTYDDLDDFEYEDVDVDDLIDLPPEMDDTWGKPILPTILHEPNQSLASPYTPHPPVRQGGWHIESPRDTYANQISPLPSTQTHTQEEGNVQENEVWTEAAADPNKSIRQHALHIDLDERLEEPNNAVDAPLSTSRKVKKEQLAKEWGVSGGKIAELLWKRRQKEKARLDAPKRREKNADPTHRFHKLRRKSVATTNDSHVIPTAPAADPVQWTIGGGVKRNKKKSNVPSLVDRLRGRVSSSR